MVEKLMADVQGRTTRLVLAPNDAPIAVTAGKQYSGIPGMWWEKEMGESRHVAHLGLRANDEAGGQRQPGAVV